MSFLFFGRKKSQLVKQAESALHMAQKVIHYRRDVLPADAVAHIIAAHDELESLLAAWRGKTARSGSKGQGDNAGQGGESASVTASASAKESISESQEVLKARIEQAIEELGGLLSLHGGRIFPNSFASENIEMLVVAAILAIGIRSFFFQPFKIPTNSMWPTYAGMIPVVYDPGQQRPNALERLVNRALYWSENFYITAPASGELLIPVISLPTDMGADAQLLRESSTGKQLFGLRQVPESRYIFSVGNTNLGVTVPQDFPLEPVLMQSYFPEYKNLQAVLDDYRRKGQVEINTHMGTKMPVYVIRTGIRINEGDPVLDFDIKTGDMLFVDRFSYNFVSPKIGDPIVFRTDNIPGLRNAVSDRGPFLPDERYYIKRLVGIAGDKLEVRDTGLFINGELAQGAPAFNLNAERANSYPGYEARWQLANGKTDTVRPGYLYAMGDNSPESYDSRGWGYDFSGHYLDKRTSAEKSAGVPANQVPERDVVGKAMFIFYPLEPRWGLAK